MILRAVRSSQEVSKGSPHMSAAKLLFKKIMLTKVEIDGACSNPAPLGSTVHDTMKNLCTYAYMSMATSRHVDAVRTRV